MSAMCAKFFRGIGVYMILVLLDLLSSLSVLRYEDAF